LQVLSSLCDHQGPPPLFVSQPCPCDAGVCRWSPFFFFRTLVPSFAKLSVCAVLRTMREYERLMALHFVWFFCRVYFASLRSFPGFALRNLNRVFFLGVHHPHVHAAFSFFVWPVIRPKFFASFPICASAVVPFWVSFPDSLPRYFWLPSVLWRCVFLRVDHHCKRSFCFFVPVDGTLCSRPRFYVCLCAIVSTPLGRPVSPTAPLSSFPFYQSAFSWRVPFCSFSVYIIRDTFSGIPAALVMSPWISFLFP